MSLYPDLTCDDLARREILIDSDFNGIDYIEVPKEDQYNIHVYFIKPNQIPYIDKTRLKIEGGVRIKNIRVIDVGIIENQNNSHLIVRVNQRGDFSIYTLVIQHPQLDTRFSRHPFSFKAGCPTDFDCQQEITCRPGPQKEPVIDYMAKDYAGFRRALMDFIPTVMPGWQERHEADFGMVLLELLAYVGDRLSYYQDAVANEAYLETARQRESVRRHARLIDYNMHDGANARTFIHVKVAEDTGGTIPAGTVVTTSVDLGDAGTVIPTAAGKEALRQAGAVFETVEKTCVNSKLNEIKIHTRGNRLCCVPKGSTLLELKGDFKQESLLNIGDLLLVEEVKAPNTGKSCDANPEHRQVVRLTSVESTYDELMKQPLTRVSWAESDALTFPLCLSAKLEDGTFLDNVSVARGNIAPVDHGQTMEEWHPDNPINNPAAQGITKSNATYRFKLHNTPITFHTPPQENEETQKPSAQDFLQADPHQTAAHCRIQRYEDQPDPETGKLPQWEVVSHLLDSNPFHRHVVLETGNDGKGIIRFGDGTFGMAPPDGSHFKVIYRVGNGTPGNIGAESLVHIVEPGTGLKNEDWPDIAEVRNPLPAVGGVEPETLDQVKLLAPKAFHARQFRAVTEEDYAAKAEEHPEVSNAVAMFRWTGSWHTVFITIDPLGRRGITPGIEERVRSYMNRFKLAGYDIRIVSPLYVPLEIEINICVAPEYFRAHVKQALLQALSNREFPHGEKGFFHPDNFTFGQPVYLSRLYERVQKVGGVDSAKVILFKRFDKKENNELKQGYIPMGQFEIACLDNDLNFQENGVLRLNIMGGK